MPIEIERKFLVVSEDWRIAHRWPAERYCQGYLAGGGTAAPTVRIRRAGPRAWLTVKDRGHGNGRVRSEFEYPIPLEDAEQMLAQLCRRPLIAKTRHEVAHAGQLWQVDVFEGENEGLVLAEIELAHPDQWVELPPWVGAEVTADPRYRNSALGAWPMGAGRGRRLRFAPSASNQPPPRTM